MWGRWKESGSPKKRNPPKEKAGNGTDGGQRRRFLFSTELETHIQERILLEANFLRPLRPDAVRDVLPGQPLERILQP